MNTPTDQYYDYSPVSGVGVAVGMDLLALETAVGAVTAVTAPSGGVGWLYDLDVEAPWGVVPVTVEFPTSPASQPDGWWHRIAAWTRTAKLGDGSIVIAADGSRWIYSDAGDRSMLCFKSGTVYSRNARRQRGLITADPRDVVVPPSTEWDWLPVKDGATVDVGDVLTVYTPRAGIVAATVDTVLDGDYVRTEFQTGDGSPIGFVDSSPTVPTLAGSVCSFYFRELKPPTYVRSVAADESKWIYSGTDYYCWSAGSRFSPGSVYPRGEIAGLIDLPDDAPAVPPAIREVVQTADMATSATLTVSPSTVAGDVLLIFYAVMFFTTAPTITAPTSTAGTVTQVGSDVNDGRGNGQLSVFRCPVDTDGEHTVTVPAAAGSEVMAVVLVLTDDAAVDGFASSGVFPSDDAVSLPSVSPTGTADLLIGAFMNNDFARFDLAGSGLTVRGAPVSTYGALTVATVELESDAPTSTDYTAGVDAPAYSAAVAVAVSR